LNSSGRISQPFNSIFLSQQISISISISCSAVLLQPAEQGEYSFWDGGSPIKDSYDLSIVVLQATTITVEQSYSIIVLARIYLATSCTPSKQNNL
jgi:hypothetical protein